MRPARRLLPFAVVFAFVFFATAAPPANDHAAGEFPGFDKTPIAGKAAVEVSPAFATSIHTEIVRSDPRAKACTDVLAREQWRQDVVLAFDATAHFDNCRFADSYAYLRAQMKAAEAAGSRKDRDGALTALGRALHGIQDFYSHSNYVELQAAAHPKFSDVQIVPLWNDDGEARLNALVGGGLRSGYVAWEPGDACVQPELTHAVLNKDRPEGKGSEHVAPWPPQTYHQAARDLARQATEAFLHAMLQKPQLASVGEACHSRLGYLLLADNRKGK